MKTSDSKAILETLQAIQSQLAELAARVAILEGKPAPAAAPPADPPVEQAAAETISEEHLMALTAAIGAFLGVRARIRSISVISSPAWAQQGRVSVQASHRLY